MTRSDAQRERDMIRRIKAVIACKSPRFRDVLEAAEIDPATGFRFKNLSGLSFVGEDLRGLDFTGANLCGCNFVDALIDGARFVRARLGQLDLRSFDPLRSHLKIHISLRSARDPSSFSGWQKIPADVFDDHLPAGSIFMDSLSAPEMFVMPAHAPRNGNSDADGHVTARYAISRSHVNPWHLRVLDNPPSQFGRDSSNVSRRDAQVYCEVLTKLTGRRYRLPKVAELRSVFGSHIEHFDDPSALEPSAEVFTPNSNADRNVDNARPAESREWCNDTERQFYVRGAGRVEKLGLASITQREGHPALFHVVQELRDRKFPSMR